jgi:hypothetical protein
LEAIGKIQGGGVMPSDLVQTPKNCCKIIEPHFNAIVTPCWEHALENAAILDNTRNSTDE